MAKSILRIAAALILIAGLFTAIAIPNLMESKKMPGVSAPVATLWLFHTAEEEYMKNYGKYATLAELHEKGYLGELKEDEEGKYFTKNGYDFRLTIVTPDTWHCIATPSEWDITGTRNFMITDKRNMYVNSVEGGTEFTEEIYKEYREKSRRHLEPRWPL